MLKEGTTAPEFEVTLDNGEAFRLSDERGKRNVVLYFYPKDFTPGCTKEACAFRDNYAEVERHDAVIIGVSTDSTESHQAFREKHELPFPLIPDPEKKIVSLYKAHALLGLMNDVSFQGSWRRTRNIPPLHVIDPVVARAEDVLLYISVFDCAG